MKSLLRLKIILMLLLLFLFIGCELESIAESASNEYINMIELEPEEKDEYICLDEHVLSAESVDDEATSLNRIVAARDVYANFTSTWAKTEEHFFFTSTRFTTEFIDGDFALYRLPLDDITKGGRIDVPGDGEIEILGLDEQYLFVSRRYDDPDTWRLQHYEVYRISLLTLDAMLIDEGAYYGVPFFKLTNNSILFSHVDFDNRIVWLEYLYLDTGARHTFFEFESDNFHSLGTGWWQMEDGSIVFINSIWGGAEPGSDFILIDSELQSRQIQLDEIDGTFMRAPKPLSLDDTQDIFLQDNIDFTGLFSINDILIATIFPRPHRGEASAWYEAIVLAEDGSTVKVLGGGWYGHNAGFGIQQLAGTDMIMIKQLNYFKVDGWVLGLYCTTTGVLFSLVPQEMLITHS